MVSSITAERANCQQKSTSKNFLVFINDLDLFCLNTNANLNPDCNLGNQPARYRYFSPHSFSKFKHTVHNDQDSFPLLHNNVRSLKRNLKNLQVHLLDELDYYSHFVQDAFNMELLQIDWKISSSVDESFAQFYNKLNKLINKHAQGG